MTDLPGVSTALDNNISPASYPLPVSIPKGARLAMRGQSNITNATDRIKDAVLYGVVP